MQSSPEKRTARRTQKRAAWLLMVLIAALMTRHFASRRDASQRSPGNNPSEDAASPTEFVCGEYRQSTVRRVDEWHTVEGSTFYTTISVPCKRYLDTRSRRSCPESCDSAQG